MSIDPTTLFVFYDISIAVCQTVSQIADKTSLFLDKTDLFLWLIVMFCKMWKLSDGPKKKIMCLPSVEQHNILKLEKKFLITLTVTVHHKWAVKSAAISWIFKDYTPNQKLPCFVLYLKSHQHLFEK